MSDDRDFETDEDLLNYLREMCDDVECVEIRVDSKVTLTESSGRQLKGNLGAILKKVAGDAETLHYKDLESALNEGMFTRCRIPIRIRLSDRLP